MAAQTQRSFGFRAGNLLMRGLLALGASFNGAVPITVPGRKTGRPRSTPIVVVQVGGQRYVQSPFGNVNWVRNLRAAGAATLSRGRRRERIRVVELTPEQAAPVIRSMLATAPGFIRAQFAVTSDCSLAEIARDASGRPMFKILPA